MNWLDSIIIIVLVYGALNGLRRGLISSVFKLVGLILSMYMAKTYYVQATAFIIENTDLEERIMEFVLKKGLCSNLIDIPLNALKLFASGKGMNSNIDSFITVSILNAASLLAIFIGCRIGFTLVELFLNSIFKLPGLNDVNRLGGLFVGLTVSLFGLLVLFAILIPICNIGSWKFMNDSIRTSMLSKYFYSYNFILSWILESAMDFISGGIN